MFCTDGRRFLEKMPATDVLLLRFYNFMPRPVRYMMYFRHTRCMAGIKHILIISQFTELGNTFCIMPIYKSL